MPGKIVNISIGGNTSGTIADIRQGTVLFAGGDNVTLSQIGNNITIVGGAGGPGGGSQSIGLATSTAGGGTGGTSGNASGAAIQYAFYAGSNVTLSQSVNGASGSLSVYGTSGAAQTVESQSLGLHTSTAGGGTGGTSGYASGGNVQYNYYAGSNLTLSQSVNGASGSLTFYGTSGAAQTVESQSIGMATSTAGGGTGGTSGYASGGQVAYNYYAGSNITLSQSVNGASGSISIYGTSGAAQSAEPRVISLNGTSGSLSLVGASNITVSALNISTITIYGPANILNSFSLGGNTATTGSSNITGGGFILAGGANITLQQSNDSISISAAAAGGANTLSYYENFDYIQGTSTQTVSGTIHHVQPFMLPYNLSASYFRVPVSISIGASTSNATLATSAATRGATHQWYYSHILGVFTRGVGASSLSLQNIFTTQAAWTKHIAWTIGAGTGGNTQMSSVYAMSYNAEGAASNMGVSISESTNSMRQYLSVFSNFTGVMYLDIPFATSLSAGQYWFGYLHSSSSATTGTTLTNMTNQSIAPVSFRVLTQDNVQYARMGIAAVNTMQYIPGLGSWTTNTTGRTTASYALANITTSASNVIWPIQIARTA